MIEAQLQVATQNGATIIREIVSDIQDKADQITVHTREGKVYHARKILITAGGFTNLILNRKLALQTRAHNILLAEIPDAEVQRLTTMPALITSFDNSDVPSMYMLPPVCYPDGKTYIKLGSAFRDDVAILPEHFIDVTHSGDAVRAWFQSNGRDDITDALKTVLNRLIPNLKITAYNRHPCLITTTAHDNPYIDTLVSGRIYVTTGGNGSAAKSADEIGRIGAMLTATDTWQSELKRDDFRAVFLD
jgi:sarcosine oxidase